MAQEIKQPRLSPEGGMHHAADSSDDRQAKRPPRGLVRSSDQSSPTNETETTAATSAFTKIKKKQPENTIAKGVHKPAQA